MCSIAALPLDVEVRQLNVHEWTLFRDLRLTALQTDPAAFESTAAEEATLEDADWLLRMERRAVAFVDGDAVGMVGWSWGSDAASDGQLIGMWVHPKLRGTGAADALVQYVKKVVVDDHGRELGLGVRADNPRARRFYERCGFRVIGEGTGRNTGAQLLLMRYEQ
jgi:ribosomal protein S18 acetylase RimI-like enzyme